MSVSSMIARRTVWSIAVFVQRRLDLPPQESPQWLFETKSLMRLPSKPHTRADPFLFSHQGRLWIFFETQIADDFGRIEAAELAPGGIDLIGVVLQESFHLSYPCVFEDAGEVFMLPETQGAEALRLYRFDNFPREIVFQKILREGRFADPSVVKVAGIWYIFATSARGLELFYTDNLLDGELQIHPASPITADPRFARCGGAPFYLNGLLVRPAQDATKRYGGNLNLMLVDKISKSEYQEELHVEHILDQKQVWNSEGGHHLSVSSFGNSIAVALDGQTYDYWIHKILMRLWMTATGRQRR